jgi:hypothetical protein
LGYMHAKSISNLIHLLSLLWKATHTGLVFDPQDRGRQICCCSCFGDFTTLVLVPLIGLGW